MDTTPRLGVDIGRVVIDGPSHPAGGDTAFFGRSLEVALATPPMADLFVVLPRLVERFDGRVWLISKCGDRIRDRSLAWLEHHRFWERTGIDPTHARFCRERPQKADHCRELGITHMVDDKLDVHAALRGLVEHRYLFGPQRRPAPAWVDACPDWPAVEAAIGATVAGRVG
jgi:hypothetical protein